MAIIKKMDKKGQNSKKNWKLVKIGEKLRNDHNSQNWSKLESIFKMVAIEKKWVNYPTLENFGFL